MAFLKILTSVALFLGTSFASELSVRSDSVLESIQNCDWLRASLESKKLDSTHPQAAILYRLAWLQVHPQSFAKQGPDLDSDPWIWEKTTERWEDEKKNFNSRSCQPQEGGFEELPQDILDALLSPAFSSLEKLDLPLRKVLEKYAFFRYLEQKPLEIPNFEKFLTQDHSEEKCAFQTLRFLHKKDKRIDAFEKLRSECPTPNHLKEHRSSLEAAFLIEGGDLYWNQGDMKKAFSLFQKAALQIPENAIPPFLAYRIAVSGLLGSTPEADTALRRSYELLIPDPEKQTSSLEPVFQSGLQNLTCEFLAQLRPQDSLKTLEKVFQSHSLVNQTLFLTTRCRETELSGLWNLLLRKPPFKQKLSITQKASLLSLLIKSHQASERLIKMYISELANLSFEAPTQISRHFWDAISPTPESKKTETETEKKQIDLARLYLSKAQITPLDLQKMARLEKALNQLKNNSTKNNQDKLKQDVFQSQETIRLSFALAVPRVLFLQKISLSFFDLLADSLRITSR